jgi:UDP-N-acetylmuramate--alanine ligase
MFKSFVFWKNIIAATGLALAFIFLMGLWLKVHTHHGERYVVGNYVGLNLDEAHIKAKAKTFEIVVSDSIFRLDMEPHLVLSQNPISGSGVKRKRKIYLTITSGIPPMITLPSLVGAYNYDQYVKKLNRLGISGTILSKQYNDKLEENTILGIYLEGKQISEAEIKAGYQVAQGSEIRFVITERYTGRVTIPDLVCKKYPAAAFIIEGRNLVVGEVFGEFDEISEAYIWRQEPSFVPDTEIELGTTINLYLQKTPPQGCPVTF